MKKERLILIVTTAFFFIFFSLISIVRHYNFHSNAYDLGIYNQALYQYSHFFSHPTIDNAPSRLGDHVEITFILLAPFYFIFGSYTLLIFQILAVCFAGIGIYLLTKKNTNDAFLAVGAMIIFHLSFGTIAAVNYDFHNNVLGIAFLPWLILALQNNKYKHYFVLLALFLLSKESMPILAFFLGMSILIFNPERRKIGLITALISVCYFIFAIYFIIPYFNQGHTYGHWDYLNLGTTTKDGFLFIITHPLETFLRLFNHEVKLLTWTIFLASGGIIAIFYVPISMLLIPVAAQKFLTDLAKMNTWGYRHHYSIELSLILAMALPLVLVKFKKKARYLLLFSFITINFFISSTLSYTEGFKLKDILTLNYYYRPEAKKLREIIDTIPTNTSVSAMDNIVPHLENRKNIFLYGLSPVTDESDYVLLNNRTIQYPLSNSEVNEKFQLLLKNQNYKLIDSDGSTFLFYKTQNQ